MLKKISLIIVSAVTALWLFTSNAYALELDESVRTVKLNEQGEQIVFNLKQVEKGQRLFNDTCSQCHAGGRTKTNPNIGLSEDSLAGAEPPRDSVVAIVEYLKNPKTYDGEEDISLFHPNTSRSDLYPEMRNLTDEDLKVIAGHILIQPKVRGVMWGGGKVYN